MNRTQIRMLQAYYPAGDAHRGAPYGERLDPTTLAVAAIGGALFSAISAPDSPQAAPQAPIAAPTVMPIPDDAAVKKAQQRQLQGLATRRGRQSTILDDSTNSGDLLGG